MGDSGPMTNNQQKRQLTDWLVARGVAKRARNCILGDGGSVACGGCNHNTHR